jgi:hypothetical protein
MRKYVFSLILGSILIGTGSILLSFEIMQYKYSNSYPIDFAKSIEQTDYYNLDDNILTINLETNNYMIIKDENIKNQIDITYNYYPNYVEIIKEEKQTINNKQLNIDFNLKYENNKAFQDFYNTIMNNLKNKQIYNYSLIFKPFIQITINPNDSNKIKVITD